MQETLQLTISGKVQGVCYRLATQEKAQQLGVHGWVKNLPGGQVVVVAQGQSEKIQALIEWCRNGPVFARVEDVDVSTPSDQENFNRFSIRY